VKLLLKAGERLVQGLGFRRFVKLLLKAGERLVQGLGFRRFVVPPSLSLIVNKKLAV
jgi:acylphosphatase